MTLEAPGDDRGVVDGTVDREIKLHVPLQPVDDRAAPADTKVRRELVGDRVRDHVPVAGRRLGARPVRPELRDRSVEVALPHELGRVRATGGGIDRAAVPVVRPEAVGAERTRGDVDRGGARRVEEAAVADDLNGLRLEEGVGRWIAEPRLRSGIEGHPRRAAGRDGKRRHVSPVRPDRLLHAGRQDHPVLAHLVLDLERLPPVRIDEFDLRQGHDERRVDRPVIGRGVPVRLVRTVRLAVIEYGLGDPIA